MVERTEGGNQRAARPTAGRQAAQPLRRRWQAWHVTSGRLRAACGLTPRLILMAVVLWAYTGRFEGAATVAGAAGLPPGVSRPDGALQGGPIFPETGFAVADGPIGNYFQARGGVRTFGPPISNAFPLLGSTIQIFRNHVLKVEAGGNVSTINLFALGAIPFRTVGGYAIPEADQALLSAAPMPGAPEYGTRVMAFIRANAPDQWEGLPVGFHQAFLGTVRVEEALPNGGEVGLLPLFSHEIWGVPVTPPVGDAQNPDAVLLRWERGIMVWQPAIGTVTALPLGETFKALLTGEGLTPEQQTEAAGSQFLGQAASQAPNGVARPSDLPNTVLSTAFAPGGGAVNAAQLSDPYSTPMATPTLYPANQPSLNPAYATQPAPPPGSAAYPGAGALPGTSPEPGALPGAIPGGPASGTTATSDPCYQDEQITFAPAEPRVNNEVLIAVTSSRPHPYGRLAGTEKTTFVRERPGQLGYVWEWTVALTYPGQHEYTFYVDSTIPCKKIELTVRQSLATRTPTPTKEPTPYGFSNNGNDNNNNDNNISTNNAVAPYRDPYPFTTMGNAYDCGAFQSQAEAQRVLRANPSDPNLLDTEDGVRDGIACSTYNYSTYPNDRDFSIVQH